MEAADKLNEQVAKYVGLNKKYYIKDENVLILWNNIPDEKTMDSFGHSNDYLIQLFCKKINEKNADTTRLFISSSQTLAGGTDGFGLMLKRLVYIWKNTGVISTFLEGDFLEQSTRDDLNDEERREYDRYMEESEQFEQMMAGGTFHSPEKSAFAETIFQETKDMFKAEVINPLFYRADSRFFTRFAKTLENLLELIGSGKTEAITEDDLTFINLYKSIQMGETVENAKNALNASRDIFYKWADRFHANPIYAEYMKCFSKDLNGMSRVFTRPDFICFLRTCTELRVTSGKNKNKTWRDVSLQTEKMFSEVEFDGILRTCLREYANLKHKSPGDLKDRIREEILDEKGRKETISYIENELMHYFEQVLIYS